MGDHLIGGEFQSDKYPTCPRGKVPLSVKDPTAQDLLYTYAQRRRAVDAGFADDLEAALLAKGYEPPPAGNETLTTAQLVAIEAASARETAHVTAPAVAAGVVSKYGRCACSACIADRHAMAVAVPRLIADLKAAEARAARWEELHLAGEALVQAVGTAPAEMSPTLRLVVDRLIAAQKACGLVGAG